MAAAFRVDVPKPDAELELIRSALHRLADDTVTPADVVIVRRSTQDLCAAHDAPLVPILVDGRGVLVGPVRSGTPGCPCCAVARRTQHGLGSGHLDPAQKLIALGRTMTAATAWLVAVQAVALLHADAEQGLPAVREVDPRTAEVRSWPLIPDEECHCART